MIQIQSYSQLCWGLINHPELIWSTCISDKQMQPLSALLSITWGGTMTQTLWSVKQRSITSLPVLYSANTFKQHRKKRPQDHTHFVRLSLQSGCWGVFESGINPWMDWLSRVVAHNFVDLFSDLSKISVGIAPWKITNSKMHGTRDISQWQRTVLACTRLFRNTI